MNKSEAVRFIHRLEEEHSRDKDGGYALVAAITSFIEHLNADDQRTLREHLIELVEDKDPDLWGVALEVLVREKASEVGGKIEAMLRTSVRTSDWTDQIILALLKLGHKDALDIYIPYIQTAVNNQSSFDCVLMANLYRVDPFLSIKMSSQFFAERLSSEKSGSGLQACMPVFIYTYTEKDEEPLLQLIDQTFSINSKAGKRLKQMIIDYLDKPWVEKELGREKLAELQTALNHVM